MLLVLGQFRVVFRSIRRHYRRVEQHAGVSGAQLWALAHVAQHPGSNVGELARALAIHPSTASNLINRLVSLGLVVRRREGPDRRVVRLHASARSRGVLKRAPQPLIGVLQQALSGLPPPGLNGLHRHLASLIRAMKIKDIHGHSVPLSDA